MLTIAGLIEAMAGVAVGCEDGDFVAAVLQPDGGVNHQALSAADAEIWMKKDDVLLGVRHRDSCS